MFVDAALETEKESEKMRLKILSFAAILDAHGI